MLRRRAPAWVALVSLLVPAALSGQTVLSRARLGNRIEDLTFVQTGRLANHLAFSNGYEILLAKLHPQGGPNEPASLTKLFDVRTAGLNGGGRGLAYIPPERLFAFHSAFSADLYLVDENGVFKGTRPVAFPGSPTTYAEGMDYIPKSSLFYPDRLILIANWFADGSQQPRLEIIRRDGTVEAEITVKPYGPVQPDGFQLFDPGRTLLGLAYLAPDKLLVTQNDVSHNIWVLDFSGNVIGTGPVFSEPGRGNIEGIVQLADGRVAAADFVTGVTRFFDRRMNRLPDQDRTYSVGLGLAAPFGIAWNSDTNRHLVLNTDFEARLTSVSPGLDSASHAVLSPQPDLSSFAPVRLTYDSASSLAVTWLRHGTPLGAHNFLTFYDAATGAFAYETDFSNTGGATPRALEYIPTTDRFAIVIGSTPAFTFKLAPRTGAPFVTLDLSAAGLASPTGIALFDPADPTGGRLLVSDNRKVAVFDLAGTLLPGGFDLREKLGVFTPTDISAITSGPQAGAFAIMDGENSEIVVFTLPNP